MPQSVVKIVENALGFIGAKIDAVRTVVAGLQKPDLTETNTSITRTNEAVLAVAREVAGNTESRRDDVVAAVAPLLQAVRELKLDVTVPPTEAPDLTPIVSAIKKLRVDPRPEINHLGTLLETLATAIQKVPPIDVVPVVSAIGRVEDILLKDAKNEKDVEILAALKGILKELKDTMKALSDKKPVYVGGGGGTTYARNMTITNVSLASTSSEYTYTFPKGTLGWIIKLRDQGTLAYYAWTTGKLPTSGDGSAYMTIPQNFLRSQEGVNYNSKTIYLGAESNGQVLEVETYTV